MKTLKLKSQTIPALGFGTWQITNDICQQAVEIALEVGYRHIDAAAAYGNQVEVGKALKVSGLNREEYFVTSKLWIANLGKEKARVELHKTLEELGLDYLNLYLMHWPKNLARETLEAFEEFKDEGLISDWGVSNCTVHHLLDYISWGFKPVNNQVEFHPSLNQAELKTFCDANEILLTAYSPIAQGADLKLPVIQQLADKYGRSTSQVILNWIVSKGIVAIPKSSSRDHIQDNFGALDWKIEQSDIELIDSVNSDNRLIAPDWAEFEY